MEKTKLISVRVDEDVLDWVDGLCHGSGALNRSYVIRALLRAVCGSASWSTVSQMLLASPAEVTSYILSFERSDEVAR